MSSAGSLKDQEEAAASDAGNADDGVNPSQQAYDRAFNGGSKTVELHGDTVLGNYNADPEEERQALQDQEQSPQDTPSLYTHRSENQGESSGMGKLAARFMAGSKRFGPTGGVVGLLFGIFGVTSVIGAPMSLLTAFSDLTSNHTGISNHLFIKSGKSYVASFLKGQTRDCATATIKCKFTTINEKRLNEWKARGVEVDAEKTAFGRYKVRGLTYRGTSVKSIRDFNNLKNVDVEFYSLLKKYPVRAYLLDKSPFRSGALKKFGKSLADRFKSSTDEDKKKRTEANDKAMNDQTKSQVDADGNVSPEKTKDEAEKKVENARKKVADNLKSFKTAFKVTSGTSTGVVAACMAYNVVRATQAAMVLYWHQKLIDFALPFLQAGAQAKEDGVNSGDFTWQTAEYAGDRLTQPITQKDIDADPNDEVTQDMLGKTAMDSKGIDAVINGGFANINNPDDYASKYTGWMPSVFGIGIVRQLQDIAGKDNIHTACEVARVTQLFTSIACIANLPKCVGALLAYEGLVQLFGDDILEAVTKKLEEPALEQIAKANLSSNLHGPELGQALVAGAGVLSSYMDNASGFAFAGSDDEVAAAYNDMYADQDYMLSELADGRKEAEKNQLDPTNKFSFAGQLASTLGAIPYDGTLFSSFANMISITARSPLLLQSASAMQQGLYQPVEVFSSQDKIDGALKNCQNPGLQLLGVPCLGESGRAVPMFLPTINDCMNEELKDNDVICDEQAVDHLAQYTYGTGDNKKPYIDETTGKPSDWSEFSATTSTDGQEKDYDNPFLMFMQYCGRDRVYPAGYTDKEIESGNDDWHTMLNCFASKNHLKDSNSDGKFDENQPDDERLGWMAYYYHKCIAMYASENDLDYCWDDKAATTTQGNGDVCSLLNNPHIHYEQKATEEDLKKLCAGETVKDYCGSNITINPDLIKALTTNATKYDITINNFGFEDDRHVTNDCQPGKQHWKGNGVDISKVSRIDGGQSAGNGTYGSVSYTGSGGQLLSDYASDFLATLPNNRGGVGQKGCSSTFNPTFPAGSTNVNGAAWFSDSCDHLHIDVRDRTNLNGI